MLGMGKRVGNLFLCLIVGLTACAAPAAKAAVEDTAMIRVFFTDPGSSIAQFTIGGPDEDLQAAIEHARVNIDVAIYDLNLYSIRDALIAAEGRGVQVRIVVESDNFTGEELALFTNVGIPVVGDEDPDSMHNKFLIIDRYEVWTGSMNYTLTDTYRNRNNLVRLRSGELAENYEAEFEEMFSQRLFGAHSPDDTPNREVEIGNMEVENYFAPEDGALSRLVELINGAVMSIYFLTYSITTDELAQAILLARARGVEIQGVMDKGQSANAGGEFDHFVESGIDVRLDGEEGNMHNKVLIIDGEIVVTGSYNFSANAEKRNDENLLVIHSPEVASMYMEEFQRIWELSLP